MSTQRSPFVLALVVLLGGLVASAVAAAAWRGVLRSDAEDTFARSAFAVDSNLTRQIDDLSLAGRQVRGAILGGSGADGPSPESFDRAVAGGVAEIQAGVVASVAYVEPAAGQDELTRLRDRVKADGLADFNVSNLAPGNDHMIATFETPGGQAPVFDGLDLASVPAARVALEAARTEGNPIVSDGFEALPEAAVDAYPTLGRSGLGVVVPVYSDAGIPTPEARHDDLQGWVVMVVSAEDLLEQAVTPVGPDLEAQLTEIADPDAAPAVSSAEGGALVASTTRTSGDRAPSLEGVDPVTRRTTTIVRSGQRWSLTVADPDGAGGGAAAREPLLLLAAGAALSVLLAAFLWSLANTRAGALRLAAQATSEVRRTASHFRALVQNLPDLIVVTDDDQVITYVSPSVSPLLGWEVEQAVGASLLDIIHPEDRVGFEQVLSSRQANAPAEARVLGSDREYVWFEGTVTNLFDDPAVAGMVITAHDVTAQKAVEDQLAHDATHDALTRLPNRVIVHDRLAHALDRSKRDGSRAAAIFLDIDEFKLVNDTWGHATGDDLLREVANRVKRAARGADTVGRYGGDEFMVICEDVPSAAEALVVAERIMDEVSRPADLRGREIPVGTSIGVALSSGPGESLGALIDRADAAMYEAKGSGRGRIVIDAAAEPTSTG